MLFRSCFNFYNLVGIIFFFQLAWMIGASLLSKPHPRGRTDSAVWTSDLAALEPSERPEPYPWYKRLVLWWALAAVATVALYVIYR